MKKPLAFLLALCLTLTPALAAEEPILDWAVPYYDHLAQADIHPQTAGDITRGEFLELLTVVLSAALPADVLDRVESKPAGYFSDNYSDPYMAAVMERAAAYGITEGWVDLADGRRYGNFQNSLTRQEAAKMLCTTLDFFAAQGHEVAPAEVPAVYTDAHLIPDWAAPFTGQVAAYGIMRGDEDLNFNPTTSLDWPSAAVMSSRLLTLMQAGA